MITKNSRSRFAGLRILSVLPVALLLPALFSCAEKTVNSQEGAPVEISVAEELPIEEAVAINVVEARSEQKAPERPIKVETMPEFPGGDKALKKFLEQNVKFPESLRDSETKDVVMVRFTVDETGKVMGVHSVDIGKPVNELFKEEAIRVVKSMPKWIPGSHEGKLVSVLIQQDIKFVNTKKPSPSGNQTEAIAEPRVLDNNPE